MKERPSVIRRAAGKAGKIAALALAITLAAALYPYVRDAVGRWLPKGRYERVSQLLSHEMELRGDLIAVTHRDTGLMEAGMNALIVGSVNSVKAPYSYEIGLGVRLRDVTLTPQEDGIVVAVPDAVMLYDSFQITGEPEISDFWHLLGEENYQRMVDSQAEACRKAYTESETALGDAWDAACRELERLFSQWSGEDLTLRFVHAGETAGE